MTYREAYIRVCEMAWGEGAVDLSDEDMRALQIIIGKLEDLLEEINLLENR